MEVCKSNGDLYQKLGNLAAASQNKNLADQCQRDLLAIKGIRSQVMVFVLSLLCCYKEPEGKEELL